MGWITTIDPNTGRTYFANPTTGESRWTHPEGETQEDAVVHHNQQLEQNRYHYNEQQQRQQEQNLRYYSSASDPMDSRPNGIHSSTLSSSSYPSGAIAGGHDLSGYHVSGALSSSGSFRTQAPPQQQQLHQPYDELSLVSAGQIADMCYMQQQRMKNSTTTTSEAAAASTYTPLPAALLSDSTSGQRPMQEGDRLRTRLHALYEQLKRI